MKKTLIALAALAVVSAASAQSTVTISGLVDVGVRTIDAAGATSDLNSVAQNGSATSAIIFSGSEDLGGGMKANFRMETNPDFSAGGGLASGTGYNFVGVAGGFGEVKFGRLNSSALEANGIANPFGTAIGSGYGPAGTATSTGMYARYAAAGATGPTRFNNAIEYTSPKFAGGVTVRALIVPKYDNATTAANSRQGVTDVSVKYVNGPLTAMLGQQGITDSETGNATDVGPALAASASSTFTYLVGSYQMGAFKLGGLYFTQTGTAGTAWSDIAGYRLSGTYTTGAFTLMASAANSDDKTNVTTTGGADRTSAALGVDYALSKRTALYARYERTDLDTNSAADDVVTTMGAGIRHSF